MKKIISLLLVAIFMLVPLSVSAESEIKVILDGEAIEFDQPPVIMSDRTMVPVRAIYEALGADVEWDAASRTASGTRNGVTVSFVIDVPSVTVNFNSKTIDAPAVIVGDRTLVPVRALAEGFGVDVQWDAATRTVTLEDKDTSGVIDNYEESGDTYTYIGQLSNGIPEGYGTGTLKNYTDSYFIGLWEEGVPVVGRLYVGDMEISGFTGFVTYNYGAVHGYSEVTLDSGEVYHGNWANNTMSGYGELYMPDGSYYKGGFENNKTNGYGELYDAQTGRTLSGTFQDGVFIG